MAIQLDRFYPLTLNVVSQTYEGYGLYCLRHDPTRTIYLGSTTLLRSKLRWWAYSMMDPTTKAELPAKVKNLLASCGRDLAQWSWSLLSSAPPAGFQPNHKRANRPEWQLVSRLHETNPAVLLNSVPTHGTRFASSTIVTSTRGTAPLTYLKTRLGLRRGRVPDTLPPHSWHVDPRQLGKWGSPFVSFASYLCRSMQAVSPKVMNPSGEAIASLYADWLAAVPASERTACERGEVPYTIDAALAVPVPRGYEA